MGLTVSFLQGRVSDVGDSCDYGCTSDIVSAQCATHGFPVVKVRMVDARFMTTVSGEATLLAGIQALETLRANPKVLTGRARDAIPHLRLQYVDTGELVAW